MRTHPNLHLLCPRVEHKDGQSFGLSALDGPEIEQLSGKKQPGAIGHLHLHGQHQGGLVGVVGLDADEGGVVDGFLAKEIGFGNGLCLKGPKIL